MGMFEADSPRAARSGRRDSSFPASAIGSALPHEHVSTRRHINWPRARPRLPVRALHPTLPRSSPRLPPPPRNNTTSPSDVSMKSSGLYRNHKNKNAARVASDRPRTIATATERFVLPPASARRARKLSVLSVPSLGHAQGSAPRRERNGKSPTNPGPGGWQAALGPPPGSLVRSENAARGRNDEHHESLAMDVHMQAWLIEILSWGARCLEDWLVGNPISRRRSFRLPCCARGSGHQPRPRHGRGMGRGCLHGPWGRYTCPHRQTVALEQRVFSAIALARGRQPMRATWVGGLHK